MLDESGTGTGEIGREVVSGFGVEWGVSGLNTHWSLDLGVRTVPLWLPSPDSNDFPHLASLVPRGVAKLNGHGQAGREADRLMRLNMISLLSYCPIVRFPRRSRYKWFDSSSLASQPAGFFAEYSMWAMGMQAAIVPFRTPQSSRQGHPSHGVCKGQSG